MKTAQGTSLIMNGQRIDGTAVLEDRSRFMAVMQGGIVKAGQLTRTEQTWHTAIRMS